MIFATGRKILLTLAAAPLAAFSGGLSGEFTFVKPPPSVALIYFTEDNTLTKATSPTVDQKDKKFVNKMFVGTTGSKVKFQNSDEVDHNIYANDPKTGANFDAGLVPPGQTSQTEITWGDEAVVKIGCKIHPKMQAYVANIASAVHTIVEFTPKDKGKAVKFSLDKVADKLTKVKIWFPKHDPVELAIKKGETKEIEVMEKGQPAGKIKLVRK